MGTKPQRKRRTRQQRAEDGRSMAEAVTQLIDSRVAAVDRRVSAEFRRLYRCHVVALWAAIIVVAVLAIVL